MSMLESSGSAKSPHAALIKIDIRIHEILQGGDVSPRHLSEEDLKKFGLTGQAVLRVDGFDKFDCVKNMIALFQKMSADGSVEGIKDV